MTLADSCSWESFFGSSGLHVAHINVSVALPVSVYYLSLVVTGHLTFKVALVVIEIV